MVTHTLTEERKMEDDYYDQLLSEEPQFLAPIRRLEKRMGFITPLIWSNIIIISLFHIIIPICYIHQIFSGQHCSTKTVILLNVYCQILIALYFMVDQREHELIRYRQFTFILVQVCIFGQMAAFGITAGAHRLWSHRSYKARLPLKLLLLMFYAIAGQNSLYNWVRDHRVHHKRSETPADPHDAKRGFFFSHIGWLMMKKHPHVIREGSKIDMSDITSDPVLVFFNRYFNILKFLFCFFIPTVIPIWCFGESLYSAVVAVMVRYLITLNATWSVNSFAHLHGLRPYDKSILPSENLGVSIIAMGEGWHNFHHTFPWDYKAAELSYFVNPTTAFLDIAALCGLAYDLKTASPELIKAVAEKRGEKRN